MKLNDLKYSTGVNQGLQSVTVDFSVGPWLGPWYKCIPEVSVVMASIQDQKSLFLHICGSNSSHFNKDLFTFNSVLKMWILKCFICFISRTTHLNWLIGTELFGDDWIISYFYILPFVCGWLVSMTFKINFFYL